MQCYTNKQAYQIVIIKGIICVKLDMGRDI